MHEISSSNFQEFSDSWRQQDWLSEFTKLRIKTMKSTVNLFHLFLMFLGFFWFTGCVWASFTVCLRIKKIESRCLYMVLLPPRPAGLSVTLSATPVIKQWNGYMEYSSASLKPKPWVQIFGILTQILSHSFLAWKKSNRFYWSFSSLRMEWGYTAAAQPQCRLLYKAALDAENDLGRNVTDLVH